MKRLTTLLLAASLPVTTIAAEPPKSLKVDLSNPGPYFTGPGSDPVNANCTACHSADMVFAQPPLTRTAWQAEVTKMIKVYKASVAEEDIPAIVDYLTKLNSPPS